jgi:hypothetical protein
VIEVENLNDTGCSDIDLCPSERMIERGPNDIDPGPSERG